MFIKKTEAARLIFLHHSCGAIWLADDNGGLGISLKDNNYFVSDTYYGWGPDVIGDSTDIGHWWDWFLGQESNKYLEAVYSSDDQSSEYSRLENNPGGENTIVMFKSCFPNSILKNGNGSIPAIDANPLRGKGYGSEHHTVENAKGIYIALLEYFKTMPGKLFIVVTAPPVQNSEFSANARAFNGWLANEWLKDYPYRNVGVFDFYDVMTGGKGDTLAYPVSADDDHPNREGNLKAAERFIPFINKLYDEFLKSNK